MADVDEPDLFEGDALNDAANHILAAIEALQQTGQVDPKKFTEFLHRSYADAGEEAEVLSKEGKLDIIRSRLIPAVIDVLDIDQKKEDRKHAVVTNFDECYARSPREVKSHGQFCSYYEDYGFNARHIREIRNSQGKPKFPKKAIEQTEIACQKWMESHSQDANANFDYVANYLMSNIANSQITGNALDQVCQSYYVIRRAYANHHAVNISTLSVTRDHDIVRYKNYRVDADGHDSITNGIVLQNSLKTMVFLGIASNSRNRNAFLETIFLRFKLNDEVTYEGDHNGLYNGMCRSEQSPFSTRIYFLPLGADLQLDENGEIKGKKSHFVIKESEFNAENPDLPTEILERIDEIKNKLANSFSPAYGGLVNYHQSDSMKDMAASNK